jgi:predicted phosphodiesterase
MKAKINILTNIVRNFVGESLFLQLIPFGNLIMLIDMKKIMTSLLVLMLCTTMAAQSADFKILYGPYLQSVTGHEATVVWVTNHTAVSWVEVKPDDGSTFFGEATRPRFYQDVDGRHKFGTMHRITLTGLQPGTAYRYRICSKEVTALENYYVGYGKVLASRPGKDTTFRTLDSTKQSASFVVLNDIHEDNEMLEKLLSHEDLNALDGVIYNGDMVSNMFNEKQLFDGFVNTSVKLFARRLPFFYARGNHETRGQFGNEYMTYFPTPTGHPYYTFRQGPVFFIVLDAAEDKPDDHDEYHGIVDYDSYRARQAQWLKTVVESDACRQAPVKIAIMHIPPHPHYDYGSIQADKLFIPLLNQAGVKLMMSGHTHRYAYYPKGESGDCQFPLLVNGKGNSVHVDVIGTRITLTIKDKDGKILKEISLL